MEAAVEVEANLQEGLVTICNFDFENIGQDHRLQISQLALLWY